MSTSCDADGEGDDREAQDASHGRRDELVEAELRLFVPSQSSGSRQMSGG